MGTKLGRPYPFLAARGEREKLIFVAAAGLALSLLIITLLVVNFKNDADAREYQTANNSSQIVGAVSLPAPERLVRAGTKLSEVKFKDVFWPRNQVPEEVVRDSSEVDSYYAKVDLQAGIPIQRASLTNEPMSMALPLTPGMRAVSLDVDATTGLEGHALPGTKVDLVLTYNEEGDLTSKVIVQNARVLSYGGETNAKKSQGALERAAPQISKTLTLEVSTEDALKIQTARQMGRISLIMRAPDDEKHLGGKDEVRGSDINEPSGSGKNRGSDCNRGIMKMGGKQYVIGCDGSINEVLDSYEP